MLLPDYVHQSASLTLNISVEGCTVTGNRIAGSPDETEVSADLLTRYLNKHPLLKRAYFLLMRDPEFSVLTEMSNIQAVKRMLYNDHGIVHAKIAAGASLEIFNRVVESGRSPSTLAHRTASSYEESMLVVLLGAMLHDVGNSVHREHHELVGAILSKPILDRVLKRLFPDNRKKVYMIRSEVLNAIVSTAYDIECLTVEAGSVKLGDGTDMAGGRARLPYRLGKHDIHAVSALSIEKVTIGRGKSKPVAINVYMKEGAGVFQVEKVLLPKLETSNLKDLIEIRAFIGRHDIISWV